MRQLLAAHSIVKSIPREEIMQREPIVLKRTAKPAPTEVKVESTDNSDDFSNSMNAPQGDLDDSSGLVMNGQDVDPSDEL